MILDKILEAKVREVEERRKLLPLMELKKNTPKFKRVSFRRSLGKKEMSLIAEVKKASPSKGLLQENFQPIIIAKTYEESGAAAISVLTDGLFFGGSLDDLVEVKSNVNLPVMRKDFIIDSYQLYESKYAGADAVLLIARVLSEEELQEYVSLAEELDMDALVEVHNEEDVEKALRCGAEILGVNNRNLETFETDIGVTLRIASGIPKSLLLVSESGIKGGDDVKRLENAGIDAVLVGESLMTSKHIPSKIRELLGGE